MQKYYTEWHSQHLDNQDKITTAWCCTQVDLANVWLQIWLCLVYKKTTKKQKADKQTKKPAFVMICIMKDLQQFMHSIKWNLTGWAPGPWETLM